MARKTSHVGAFVEFLDTLPRGLNAGSHDNSALGTLAVHLGYDPDSVSFGKVMLWLGAFIQDGRDVIGRSEFSESNRDASLAVFNQITTPFRFPFAHNKFSDFYGKTITQTSRSHLSLISEWISKENPIYIPEKGDLKNVLESLHSIEMEFSKLDIPEYIKRDFLNHIDLYRRVSIKIPMVAHLLVANESAKLFSWLMSAIPEDTKETVSQAALAINVLVAAFVAPAEAASAANTYYDWFANVAPTSAAIASSVAPKALPPPKGK